MSTKESVLLGSAGTGKTTYCLAKVKEWVKGGVPMNDIAYMSFSTKAAREPVSRMGSFTDTDLYWFRTLHSAAFHMLGLTGNSICSHNAIKKYAQRNGFSYRGQVTLADDMELEETDLLDVALAIHGVARNKLCSLTEVLNDYSIEYAINDVAEVISGYEAWKKDEGYMDFTDVLMGVKEGMVVPVRKAIIDEAQDLTPLQERVVSIFFADASEILFAGDDDQALYAWAGADVQGFIDKANSSPLEILKQSYRVPRLVHNIGQDIIKQCKNRVDKTYLPRDDDGTVTAADLQDIDMSKGTWLLLARNRYKLSEYVTHVTESGLAYVMSDGNKGVSESEIRAVYDWEALRKGRTISVGAALNVYDNMLAGTGYNRGSRAALQETPYLTVSMTMLIDEFGVKQPDEPWYDVLGKMSHQHTSYLRDVLRNKDSILEPRITISTIHSAKGGEADNVAIMCDVSKRVAECENDDEHRVWYVGVTRTRSNLFIIPPTGRYYYDTLAELT